MTTPDRRVLLLTHELTRTGAPRLTLGIFQGLRGEMTLRVVARDSGPLAPAFRALGDLTVLSSRQRPSYARLGPTGKATAQARDAARTRLAAVTLRAWRPEVVYVSSVLTLPLVRQLGLASVPTILHVHESTVALDGFEAAHPGLVGTVPDRYVAVSQVVADALMDQVGVAAERVAVVLPFVDPTPEMVPLGPGGPSPVVVGGLGNPAWTKGIELWLLTARAALDRAKSDCLRFRWVGLRDNDEGRHARSMVDKLGLAGMVELEPETADPARALATFDILAITSWEEAASMAVLEAMSAGIPVICFRGSGGPAEMLGGTGTVIEEFSPDAMAEAIVALALDPALRDSLRTRARARVAEAFSRARAVRAISTVIDSTTARR